MEVEEAIRTLRAVRQFTDQPLPDAAVLAILNAGRRAQSSKNTQPWQFIAVRDRATLQQLAACGPYAGHLAGAALGVVLVGGGEKETYDLGQATAWMMLAAWEAGIGSCIATVYEPDKARAILGVPADYRIEHAISFGYPADPAALAPPRQGGRRPLESVVRWERWEAGPPAE
jgi:nitroreductase